MHGRAQRRKLERRRAVALEPAFDAVAEDYRTSVQDGVSRITVEAETADADATLAFLDGDGAARIGRLRGMAVDSRKLGLTQII